MCGDQCVRVLADEQNYQEEPPRDKLVFEVYGALLPPKLKTLQEPLHDLTRHKISDRETCEAINAVKKCMANTHEVDRRLSRGSLHRLDDM